MCFLFSVPPGRPGGTEERRRTWGPRAREVVSRTLPRGSLAAHYTYISNYPAVSSFCLRFSRRTYFLLVLFSRSSPPPPPPGPSIFHRLIFSPSCPITLAMYMYIACVHGVYKTAYSHTRYSIIIRCVRFFRSRGIREPHRGFKADIIMKFVGTREKRHAPDTGDGSRFRLIDRIIYWNSNDLI